MKRVTGSWTVLLLLALAQACTRPAAPDGPQGTISLALTSAAGTDVNAMAPAVDSIAVRVFRPGPGVTLEVSGGIRVGQSATEVKLTCIAESGKRVSVGLFASGAMTHFGVNESVDVAANSSTDVVIDAYDFVVESASMSSALVNEGQMFRVSWDKAVAATAYKIQESQAADFSSVIWETTLLDTTLTAHRDAGGTHYFRVAPVTTYAMGTFTKGVGTYVLAGSQATKITSVDQVAAIPGDEVTIRGENLDYPGVQVTYGATACQIVSSAWDELVVKLPQRGTTDYLWVGSLLGWDSSPDPVVAQRIAYVTASGMFAQGYRDAIEKYADTIENSGVVVVPVTDLDWRNMSVFDVIIVGHDTGTTPGNWGGGVTGRADAIAGSGSNILAVGAGGANYLANAAPIIAGVTFSSAFALTYYTPDGGTEVFNTPFKVASDGPATISFCSDPLTSITMDVSAASKPGAMKLHAALSSGVDRWPLTEFTLNVNLSLVRHFFWGYAADPSKLTSDGQNCLSNVVYLLYHGDVGPIPVE